MAILIVGCGLSWISGCTPVPATAAKAVAPTVEYVLPTEETVREYEIFNGRTAAAESVDIRARVGGYLLNISFADGAIVEKGDVLFQLDARGFQAEADRAAASLEQLKVRIERLRKQDSRAQQLLLSNTISPDAFDQLHSELNEAIASLGAADATLKLAKLNVEYSKIQSPISGKISRRLVDVGNLVSADDSVLATIVTTDPLHIYFDMNERTALKTRRSQYEGQSSGEIGLKVDIGLADETGFLHEAVVNFVDNHIDFATGTLRLRAELPNSDNLLTPGLFVRVQYPIGKPHQALLIPEESLATDQGQRCVYVVDDEDKIAYRRVSVGPLNAGRRVIETGLQPNERVVVKGLQRVRTGDKVNGKLFESPVAQRSGSDDEPNSVQTAGIK